METDDLLEVLSTTDEETLAELIDTLPLAAVEATLSSLSQNTATLPESPLAQAVELEGPSYIEREHLLYLSDQLAEAVADVRAGQTRKIVVSMPPRTGKSHLTSIYLPTWLLRIEPSWKLALVSHNPSLATSWGRAVRRIVEEHGPKLGLALAKDAGAVSEWQTTSDGGVWSRSAPGQSLTGLGFNVMLIDDVVKDFAAAHSAENRKNIWNWWLANAVTRMEGAHLIVVVGTRWHDDDFIGRLRSREYDGDPDDWQIITLPAIAEGREQDEPADVLGRTPGQPLLSPLAPQETEEQAVSRWEQIKRNVGPYAWAALYQQRPVPAKGAVFSVDWWRYWTTDPALVDGDNTILLDNDLLARFDLLDSWDATFKDTVDSDYVVGQRWGSHGALRFLLAQFRGRASFTATVEKMLEWSDPDTGPLGLAVHRVLVEDKANGPAIIDTLREEVPGIAPFTPKGSKEARAQAVTSEAFARQVLLPHPSQAGHAWVTDLLSELRNFPNDIHDDQVDALTQALLDMRTRGRGGVSVPHNINPSAGTPTALGSAQRKRLVGSSITNRRLTGSRTKAAGSTRRYG